MCCKQISDIWDPHKYVYLWPESDMVIHRSYYPDELWRDMQVTPVRHAVFVQVFNNEALEETSKYIVVCLLIFSVLFKYVMKWYAVGTTLVMLNKLRCQAHFSFPTNQFTWSGLLVQIQILNGKQWRSRSVGFFRSQLIWIYTVCKDRVYPGSAGQG